MDSSIMDDETKTALEERSTATKRIDLDAILEQMDQTELVVALIAINPQLEDILPEDEQLKRDVAKVREQLAERQLRLNDSPDSPAQVGSVVQQHVHIHLWDEKTSERLKELGTAVVDLFQNMKDKLVEAKEKYFEGDGRDVITFEEAYAGFQAGLRGMADFITRRDRSSDPAEGPWPSDAPDKATADPGDPKIKWWGYVLANFGAVPSKEYLENLQLKRDAEKAKDVVRLASSAVDEVLDDDLEPVEPKAAQDAEQHTPSQMVMISVKGQSTFLDQSESDHDSTTQDTFFDQTFGVPLDRFLDIVSDDWHAGEYDLAEDFYGRDDELLKLVAELEGDPKKFEVESEDHVITEFSATISNADEVTAFIRPPAETQEPAPKTYSFGGRDRSEPEEPMDGFLDGPPPPPDDTLYVVRSSTPNNPHYITDEAGKHTYHKSEAAQFPLDEAERLAGDHSDYAATKGYGYRYMTEEAGPVQAQQLRAGATLSQ